MDAVDMVSRLVVFAQQLHEYSKKVREGVELIQPLADALLAEDHEKIDTLREQLSEIRNEADQIRLSLYDQIKDMHFRSVDGYAFSQYLACQQGIVDASQEFADLLAVRRTTVATELRADFQAFVTQVAGASRQIMNLAETSSSSTDVVSADADAASSLGAIGTAIDGCRRARRLAMKFAQHLHSLETQLDPVTVMFLDEYCTALKEVTNNAEHTASHVCLMAQ
jgi:predicted phosphate transport protein (TIGR00153 family)